MGGSSAVEQLLMLRYALQQGMRPRMVVFGFFDFHADPSARIRHARFDRESRHALLHGAGVRARASTIFRCTIAPNSKSCGISNCSRIGATVWERVELFRRALAQQGMPAEKTNSMGRAVDFAMLEYPSAPAFVAECGRASRNPLIPSVREIALQAAAAGSKVYFVEMPMPSGTRANVLRPAGVVAGYRAHLQSMLGGSGRRRTLTPATGFRRKPLMPIHYI